MPGALSAAMIEAMPGATIRDYARGYVSGFDRGYDKGCIRDQINAVV